MEKAQRKAKAWMAIATIKTTSEEKFNKAVDLHRVSGLTYEDIFFHGVDSLCEKWRGKDA